MMNRADFEEIFDDVEICGKKVLIKKDLAKTIAYVKDNYGFSMLKEITAVDCMEQGIELIYHLYSVENEEDLVLSITVNNEAESISHIFDSAIADENEIYDLIGVNFTGNKELKRLYMPESWKGHPLRKDYKEDDERLRWND